eukprot:436222-Amphidinium_carterae.1
MTINDLGLALPRLLVYKVDSQPTEGLGLSNKFSATWESVVCWTGKIFAVCQNNYACQRCSHMTATHVEK